MASVDIIPFNISAIKWRILTITYGIVYLIARRYHNTTLIYQYTLFSIYYYNVFLLSNILNCFWDTF